jgi:hypothetical protein
LACQDAHRAKFGTDYLRVQFAEVCFDRFDGGGCGTVVDRERFKRRLGDIDTKERFESTGSLKTCREATAAAEQIDYGVTRLRR